MVQQKILVKTDQPDLLTALRFPLMCGIVMIYFFTPLAIILIGYLLYKLLTKNLPAFTALITGGR